eukprot:gb/GECH01012772.1/.p1 GENE.gb/GECH01012772.1/~~gb/GECH01012772.1/.p1  ORF type:complete len:378 (+),score=113.99 gb/GECH01012772.1/:1-1134(+)
MASHLETNVNESLPMIITAVSQHSGKDLKQKVEPLAKKAQYAKILGLVAEQFEVMAKSYPTGSEIEMIYQLLCSLAKQDKKGPSNLFTDLAKTITKNTEPRAELRIKTLTAILNELSSQHDEFFDIFMITLEYSFRVGSKQFGPRLAKGIDELMQTWGFSNEQKQKVYSLLVDIHKNNGNETKSYQLLIEYLNTVGKDNVSDPQVVSRAAETVRLALKQDIYRYNKLLRIPAISALQDSSEHSALFKLLQLTVQGNYKDLMSFGNQDLVQSISDTIPDKFRILTISSLAEQKNRISYQEIAEAIQVEQEQVEDYIIKAVSCGVIKGKLNQINEEAVIEQVTKRTMNKEDWKFIQSNLERWSDSVASALATVKHARNE